MKKVGNICLDIFAVGILISLFAGGLSFLGYLAALLAGGEAAAGICAFVFQSYLPLAIRAASISTGVGIAGMYLTGQKALSVGREQDGESGKRD